MFSTNFFKCGGYTFIGRKFSDKNKIYRQFFDSPKFRWGKCLPAPSPATTPPIKDVYVYRLLVRKNENAAFCFLALHFCFFLFFLVRADSEEVAFGRSSVPTSLV